MSWTEEDKATVFRMWDALHSSAEIAEALEGRKTRKAILGVLHRAGKLGTRTSRQKGDAALRARGRTRRPPEKPEPKVYFNGRDPGKIQPAKPFKWVKREHVGEPITLWSDWEKGRCKYPLFDQKIDHDAPLFCGAPTDPGKTYCPDCYGRMYRPAPTPEEIALQKRQAEAARYALKKRLGIG